MYKILHLQRSDTEKIIELTHYLNTTRTTNILRERQHAMFNYNSYNCLGFYENNNLVGLMSAWVTVRLYSGKQVEIDNVIIKPELQSRGLGKIFMDLITDWALKMECETIELKSYTANVRSHKFYFREGFTIPAFYFQKYLNVS